MEAVAVVNLAEICRLCLSEEGVGVPIFGGEDDSTQGGTTLSTRIMTCASLEVRTYVLSRIYFNFSCWLIQRMESFALQ